MKGLDAMKLFEGKKGLILGVANDRSIAWAIAKEIMDQGGTCGFSHLPDKPDDEKKKNRMRVSKCVENYPSQTAFLRPLDVQDDSQVQAFMQDAAKDLGEIDFLLHSIAFADRDDLSRDTVETSRAGFKLAMDVSVYSLIAVTNAVRYLAYDMGPKGVRVNGVSAGPLKTLAGVAAGVGEMQEYYDYVAPLGRCVTHEEVGRSGSYLLSSYSDGITGEILHVDSGYNIMGSPGRLLEQFRKKS